MVAGESSCTCANCGTECGGLFRGCQDVWDRGTASRNRKGVPTPAPAVTTSQIAGLPDPVVRPVAQVADRASARPVAVASGSGPNPRPIPQPVTQAVPQPPPPPALPAAESGGSGGGRRGGSEGGVPLSGQPEVDVSQSRRFPPNDPTPDREGEIANRLRALAAGAADPDTLRRGLLWVAGEVQGCEQALRQATEQMALVTDRLAGLEAREQALARGTAGIESFRRDLTWLSGEVDARSDALAQADERLTRLESKGGSGDVRGEIDRYATEVSGSADFGELARAALRSGLMEGAIRDLRDDLDQVVQELLLSQQSTTAEVTGRTAPLEGALYELRRELDRLADGMATTGQASRAEV
ncbi:MAG TPA: hypothetical protein VF244_05295, partial [Acidimicrobiales bacterium]